MRTTGPLLKVVRALLDEGQEMYGLELLRATGLKSGTLYPLLDRMAEQQWIVGRWEDADNPSGPRRRFYRLTTIGAHEGRTLLSQFATAGAPSWT